MLGNEKAAYILQEAQHMALQSTSPEHIIECCRTKYSKPFSVIFHLQVILTFLSKNGVKGKKYLNRNIKHNCDLTCFLRISTCYKTHYEVLGVEQNASQKEIKEAYIKKGKEVRRPE